MFDFNEEQIKRYSRHIILKEVGGKGQSKLLEAKVLLLGAGGLGSPCGFYLAAAGIGTLGIVDEDIVDISNLQRQILHSVKDLDKPKVISAERTLKDLNPDIKIITYEQRMTSENVFEIINDYDLVVDGTDNFATRYLINDACVMRKKPLSSGAVFRFEGQVFTIIPGDGPCYRCLYETPPPANLVPSCQEAGVLGVVPGLIGLVQATEVIKVILKVGNLLTDKLLIYDALDMDFRKVKIKRNLNCPICGDNPTIKELIDYKEFCNVKI